MNRSPVIRFIFPDYSSGTFKCHLGTAYIIAYLKARGRYADQFVSLSSPALPKLVELILKGRPKAVGFTCLVGNFHLVKLLARRIRLASPDVAIIAGGPSATFSADELLGAVPEIDICVRGEGELTSLELADHIENGKSLAGIKGVTYREKGCIVRNPDRDLIPGAGGGLDAAPSPYLSGVLRPAEMLEQYNSVMVLTTRGCAQKCAYCSCAPLSRNNVRCHSVERVISELKFIAASRPRGKKPVVHIIDDAFTFDKRRTRELCQRIITERIGLELWCDTRADYVDEDLLRLMREAGVRNITFGLESAVPRILYAMRKARSGGAKDGFRPEKRFLSNMRERVRQAKALGLDVTVNALFGFPGESRRDALKTLAFIAEMDVSLYTHNDLYVYPGTELFDHLKAGKRPVAAISAVLGAGNYSEYDSSSLPALHNRFARGMSVNYFCGLEQALTGVPVPAQNGPGYLMAAAADIPLEWGLDNLSLRTEIVPPVRAPRRISYREMMKPCPTLAGLLPGLAGPHVPQAAAVPCRRRSTAARRPRAEDRPGLELVFDIIDSKDPDAMEARLRRAASPAARTGGRTMVNLIPLDACRWSAACPAAGMGRVFLDGDGNIRPCSSGPALGGSGTALREAAARMARLRGRTMRERGCAFCPVKDSCSKCVALGAMEPADYCRTMRARGGAVRSAAETRNSNMLNYVSYLRYLQTTDEYSGGRQ